MSAVMTLVVQGYLDGHIAGAGILVAINKSMS